MRYEDVEMGMVVRLSYAPEVEATVLDKEHTGRKCDAPACGCEGGIAYLRPLLSTALGWPDGEWWEAVECLERLT